MRGLVTALLGVLVVLGLLAALGWWWLQGEVDQRVRARVTRAAASIGAEATLGAVHLEPDGTIVVSDLALQRGESHVRVFELRLVPSLRRALRDPGLGAIDAIFIDGVRVREAGDPDLEELVIRLKDLVRSARNGRTTIASEDTGRGLALPAVQIRDAVLSTDGRTLVSGRFKGHTNAAGEFRWTASGRVDVDQRGPVGFKARGTGVLSPSVRVELDRPVTVAGPRGWQVRGFRELRVERGRLRTGPASLVNPEHRVQLALASTELRTAGSGLSAVLGGATLTIAGRRVTVDSVNVRAPSRRGVQAELSGVRTTIAAEDLTPLFAQFPALASEDAPVRVVSRHMTLDLASGHLVAHDVAFHRGGDEILAQQMALRLRHADPAGDALCGAAMVDSLKRIELRGVKAAVRGASAWFRHLRLTREPAGLALVFSGRLRPATPLPEVTLDGRVRFDPTARPLTATLRFAGLAPQLDPTGLAQRLGVGQASRVSGDLRLVFGDQKLGVDGTLDATAFSLQHWRLAPERIGPLDVSAAVSAEWHRDTDWLRVQLPSITVGEARASLDLTLNGWSPKPRVDLRFELPEQDCTALANATPAALIAGLERLRVTGRTWMNARLRVDLAKPSRLKLSVDGNLDGCRIRSLGPAIDRRIRALATSSFVHRPEVNGEPVGVKVGPGTTGWTPWSQIPEVIKTAARVTEDRGFFRHQGLRLGLIRGALKLNLEHLRYVYGGSTITQQLVKNLFLTRRKDLARKFEEAIIAVQLERVLSKERILELYINCIEYGPGIWGLANAAERYYGKRPQALTATEGVYLMAIKPYPKHGWYNAKRSKRRWRKNWVKRMRGIFKRVREEGVIDDATYEAAGPDFRPVFAGIHPPDDVPPES